MIRRLGLVSDRAGVRQPDFAIDATCSFAFCDHRAPLWNGVDGLDAQRARGMQALGRWLSGAARHYRDATGLPPSTAFFFPGDRYRPSYWNPCQTARAGLARSSCTWHHDGDTRETLRAQIERSLCLFAEHGSLGPGVPTAGPATLSSTATGLGNGGATAPRLWVDDEIALLFETGCLRRFHLSSAPDEPSPTSSTAIFWPMGDLRRPALRPGRAGAGGPHARGSHPHDRGPAGSPCARRPQALRIENGSLTSNECRTPARVRSWSGENITSRPAGMVFVKSNTHGAPEPEAASLLGEGGHHCTGL